MTEHELMMVAARLNKAMSEQHPAFGRLGIDLAHPNGNPKADSTILRELCEALEKHDSLAFVYACFVDIFGRCARDVIDRRVFFMDFGKFSNHPLFQAEQ